jgi:hypothetical protein
VDLDTEAGPEDVYCGRDEIDRIAGAVKAFTLTFDISQ